MAMLDQITSPRIPTPTSAAQSPAPGVATFDDVLDETERKRVFDFLNGAGWKFGWKSNSARDRYSFWHRHFAGTRPDHEQNVGKAPDCAEELRRALPLLFEMWVRLEKTVFAGHTLARCYANGQSDGTLHTDSISGRSFTSVYYPHDTWNPNWGGIIAARC
jgi:SM-20-related protein